MRKRFNKLTADKRFSAAHQTLSEPLQLGYIWVHLRSWIFIFKSLSWRKWWHVLNLSCFKTSIIDLDLSFFLTNTLAHQSCPKWTLFQLKSLKNIYNRSDIVYKFYTKLVWKWQNINLNSHFSLNFHISFVRQFSDLAQTELKTRNYKGPAETRC